MLSNKQLKQLSEVERVLNHSPNNFRTFTGPYLAAAQRLVDLGYAKKHPTIPGQFMLADYQPQEASE